LKWRRVWQRLGALIDTYIEMLSNDKVSATPEKILAPCDDLGKA
jgi:hypothetical protein